MFDAILGIAHALDALTSLRYMFAGLFVGWLLSLTYDKVTGGVAHDAAYVIVLSCAAVGLILDIRRGLRGLRRDDAE